MWFSGFRGAMGSGWLTQHSPSPSRRRSCFLKEESGPRCSLSLSFILVLLYTWLHQIFGFGTFLQTVIEKFDVSAKTEVETEFDEKVMGDVIKLWFIKKDEKIIQKYVLRNEAEEQKASQIAQIEPQEDQKMKEMHDKNIYVIKKTKRNSLKTDPGNDEDDEIDFEFGVKNNKKYKDDIFMMPLKGHEVSGSISSRLEPGKLRNMKSSPIRETPFEEEEEKPPSYKEEEDQF